MKLRKCAVPSVALRGAPDVMEEGPMSSDPRVQREAFWGADGALYVRTISDGGTETWWCGETRRAAVPRRSGRVVAAITPAGVPLTAAADRRLVLVGRFGSRRLFVARAR